MLYINISWIISSWGWLCWIGTLLNWLDVYTRVCVRVYMYFRKWLGSKIMSHSHGDELTLWILLSVYVNKRWEWILFNMIIQIKYYDLMTVGMYLLTMGESTLSGYLAFVWWCLCWFIADISEIWKYHFLTLNNLTNFDGFAFLISEY